MGKLFRRRRGFSFQRIAEFFKPTSAERLGRGRGVGVQRRWTLKTPRRLFSTGDSQSAIPEEEAGLGQSHLRQRAKTLPGGRHSRTVSDVTEQFAVGREEESSSPNLTPSGQWVWREESLRLTCSLSHSNSSPGRRGSCISISPHSLRLYPHSPGLLLPAPHPDRTPAEWHGDLHRC